MAHYKVLNFPDRPKPNDLPQLPSLPQIPTHPPPPYRNDVQRLTG